MPFGENKSTSGSTHKVYNLSEGEDACLDFSRYTSVFFKNNIKLLTQTGVYRKNKCFKHYSWCMCDKETSTHEKHGLNYLSNRVTLPSKYKFIPAEPTDWLLPMLWLWIVPCPDAL